MENITDEITIGLSEDNEICIAVKEGSNISVIMGLLCDTAVILYKHYANEPEYDNLLSNMNECMKQAWINHHDPDVYTFDEGNPVYAD